MARRKRKAVVQESIEDTVRRLHKFGYEKCKERDQLPNERYMTALFKYTFPDDKAKVTEALGVWRKLYLASLRRVARSRTTKPTPRRRRRT